MPTASATLPRRVVKRARIVPGRIEAFDGIQGDVNDPGFDGHYADDVSVILTPLPYRRPPALPEPAGRAASRTVPKPPSLPAAGLPSASDSEHLHQVLLLLKRCAPPARRSCRHSAVQSGSSGSWFCNWVVSRRRNVSRFPLSVVCA